MSWQEIYHSKLCSADAAIQAIRSHDRVFMSGNCGVPKELLAALVRRAPELEDVEICHVLTFGAQAYAAPEMQGHLRVNTLFIGADVREAVQAGRADFTPVLLQEAPRLLRDPNGLPLDAALIHCSPPDEHGFLSYGVEVGPTKPAAEAAKIIIAEVNDHMPRSLGDSFIHVSRLKHIVPVSYPIPEVRQGQPGEVQQKIGCYIGELIPDGATMQMGLGAIPDAVLLYLRDKRDLGVHTELFSDGVMELIEAGVITNAAKSIHRGKAVAGFAVGSQRLYDFMDNNPIFEFHPQDYINDPFVIAQNTKQVSINSALEVDLTGQVCADSIGSTLYSGIGGQLDFIYGASRSQGGMPIIALPATAKDGQISRIVPTLKLGAGVVTTRYHVHWVVTEYGVAQLYGKTIRERVRGLANIAAPQFRDELLYFARQQHWI